MEKVHIDRKHAQHIPLSEVISYVENIPIKAEDTELLYNLMAIREMHIQE